MRNAARKNSGAKSAPFGHTTVRSSGCSLNALKYSLSFKGSKTSPSVPSAKRSQIVCRSTYRASAMRGSMGLLQWVDSWQRLACAGECPCIQQLFAVKGTPLLYVCPSTTRRRAMPKAPCRRVCEQGCGRAAAGASMSRPALRCGCPAMLGHRGKRPDPDTPCFSAAHRRPSGCPPAALPGAVRCSAMSRSTLVRQGRGRPDPAWRRQQELLAHGANPGAAAGPVQR